MVDMLVESSSNVEMILKFFDMFLKLKDIVASDAFRDYVTDPRGLISKKDFQKAMDSQKQYSPSEIQFLLSCSEADENDMINYEEFASRFQEPAKDIGFNIAVLLTNLSEHVPHDTRLQNFLGQAESVLNYFRPFLGRIEIMGASRKIERIYFEISEVNRRQWEMPQVRESKRQFIFDVVNEGGESEKMEMFVNFCEDTIFEMNIASQISEQEEEGKGEEDDEGDEGGGEGGPGGGGEEDSNGEEGQPESSSAFVDFINSMLSFLSIFTFRNLRRQYRRIRKMTFKEIIVAVSIFFWTILMSILHFIYNVCKGFFMIIWQALFGGGLVEGAKNITVTEILASMPDPTQDDVHGDGPGELRTGEEQDTGGVSDPGEPGSGEEEEEDTQENEGGRMPGMDAPGGLGDMGVETPVEPPTPEGTPITKRKMVSSEFCALALHDPNLNLFVWSLHVHNYWDTLMHGFSPGIPASPHRPKTLLHRLIGDSNLSQGATVGVNGYLIVRPCDRLVSCPGCIPTLPNSRLRLESGNPVTPKVIKQLKKMDGWMSHDFMLFMQFRAFNLS